MATTEIAWGDGSGDKIYVTADALEGDQTVLVSSDANTGNARSKTVTFTAGSITKTLTVSQESALPYTRVSYIETDGAAYINTGIKGNAPMSAKIWITPVAPASGNGYICGCRKDSGNTRFIPLIITSAKMAGCAYAGSVYTTAIDVSSSINNRTQMTVQVRFRAGAQEFYIKQSGESSYTSKSYATSGTITTGKDIYVFGNNYTGTSVSYAPAGTRIDCVKLFSDYTFSNLVFNGVACYYNGEYGLWDLVSNTFKGNLGTGSFSGPQ